MKSSISMVIAVGFVLVAVSATATETHTGWWHGRRITYKIADGRAIWQGDMALPISDISSSPPMTARQKPGSTRDATFIGDTSALWPNATVPYTSAAGVPSALRQFIMQAIQAYQSATPIRWIPRTNEVDYVAFKGEPTTANECGDSYVGKIGGPQNINLNVDTSSCTIDETIHEMGHAIGFEHEMTRGNRNYYVTVHYENLDKNEWSQFNQDLSQVDLLPYEYASIMHYGVNDFQRNDFNTMDTIPLGIPISHGHGLSPGDIEAVRTIYGQPSTTTTVSSNPPGLQVIVDGAATTTPQTFNWAPGSQHTLSVAVVAQARTAGVWYVFGAVGHDGAEGHTNAAPTADRGVNAKFSRQARLPTLG